MAGRRKRVSRALDWKVTVKESRVTVTLNDAPPLELTAREGDVLAAGIEIGAVAPLVSAARLVDELRSAISRAGR